MLRAGHVLDALRSVAVDVHSLPALASSATEIRLERVIVIGSHLDFQKNRHVKHVVNVADCALFATSLWCFDSC